MKGKMIAFALTLLFCSASLMSAPAFSGCDGNPIPDIWGNPGSFPRQSKGASSNDANYVMVIQQILCHYSAKTRDDILQGGGVDGLFGTKTDIAVRTFQRQNNLVSDGIVGPTTWEKLFYSHISCPHERTVSGFFRLARVPFSFWEAEAVRRWGLSCHWHVRAGNASSADPVFYWRRD